MDSFVVEYSDWFEDLSRPRDESLQCLIGVVAFVVLPVFCKFDLPDRCISQLFSIFAWLWCFQMLVLSRLTVVICPSVPFNTFSWYIPVLVEGYSSSGVCSMKIDVIFLVRRRA